MGEGLRDLASFENKIRGGQGSLYVQEMRSLNGQKREPLEVCTQREGAWGRWRRQILSGVFKVNGYRFSSLLKKGKKGRVGP